MKYFNKIALFTILVSLFSFVSCKKENTFESLETGQEGPIQLTYYGNTSDRSSDGNTILVFSDQDVYNSVVEQLQQDVDTWDDAFVAEWGHLDDDALNDKEEALNFDAEKPLTDFENQYGFNSLRKEYLAAEEAWMNNEELIDANDPDLDPRFYFDEADMSLLNTKNEIKIGNEITKYVEGGYIKVLDGDFDKLILINAGDTEVLNDDNVLVRISDDAAARGSSDCTWWTRQTDNDYYASNKKMYRILQHHGYSWKAVTKAKLKSYKRKNGRWKRYRTNLGVGFHAQFYSGGVCPTDGNYDLDHDTGYREKKRKTLSKRVRFNGNNHYRVENYWGLRGAYKYGGYNTFKRLEW